MLVGFVEGEMLLVSAELSDEIFDEGNEFFGKVVDLFALIEGVDGARILAIEGDIQIELGDCLREDGLVEFV